MSLRLLVNLKTTHFSNIETKSKPPKKNKAYWASISAENLKTTELQLGFIGKEKSER